LALDSFPPFLIRAMLAGIGISFMVAPLGAIVVWRRMAYFGDALAHAGLLGAILAMAWQVQPLVGLVIVALLFCLAFSRLPSNSWLATDTLLGLLAHASLALGMVLLSYISNKTIDIMNLLFGDILTVLPSEILLIYGLLLVVWGVLAKAWSSLLSITVHEELAAVEGIKVKRLNFIFMILLALVVAVAIKMVGILLITALLIMPVAIVRPISITPEGVVIKAMLVAMGAVLLGLFWSYYQDVPTGPAIVCILAASFIGVLFLKRIQPKQTE
jgi:zinc transport system permease protein